MYADHGDSPIDRSGLRAYNCRRWGITLFRGIPMSDRLKREAELRELLNTPAGHVRLRQLYEEVTDDTGPSYRVLYLNSLIPWILDCEYPR
jgi:hypothetical protein